MFNNHIINWDSWLDPPYDERADHIEVDDDGRAYLFGEPLDDIDTSFVEMEDEEIKALIESEPTNSNNHIETIQTYFGGYSAPTPYLKNYEV